MKILYLHPRSWTGEYPILLHLKQLGHDVCVLEEDRNLPTARRNSPYFEHPGDGIATIWYNPRKGIERLLTLPWDRYFRRAFDGRNLAHRTWVLSAVARHFRPDVVIASDGFSYAIPAAHARHLGWLNAPLVVSYIGGDILDCPEAEVGRRRTPMVNRLIRATIATADALRPVSPKVARALADDGAGPANMRVIPSHLVLNTALTDAIAAQRQHFASVIRQQYGVPLGAPLIITLSGNHKGKGLQVLAQAWPAILQRFPGARWLLCGPADPWLEREVWPQLQRAQIGDSVIRTGPLAGVAVFHHLAAADLHINPSLCESLNMVTVEAAAVGTPTITAEGAGIADWVARLSAGRVVPAGEVAPLADAILAALADPAGRAAWSAAGRTMSAEFSLDRVAAQLVELFESVRKEP